MQDVPSKNATLRTVLLKRRKNTKTEMFVKDEKTKYCKLTLNDKWHYSCMNNSHYQDQCNSEKTNSNAT